jgi:endoglucanase
MRDLLPLAKAVLSIPTAPYHEHAVRAFVEQQARQLGLPVERDRAGNVIVKYRRGKERPPLVFVAHMDHPGFEALGGNRAEFLGGVPAEWFPGARVRFGKIRTKIRRVLPGWPKRKRVELPMDVPCGTFGTWDVPMVRLQAGKLRALAIDDVLNVAVILATLSEAQRRRLDTEVWGVFTRAEEVGFHGAIEIAMADKIPREALIVSLEMSKARPWAKIGDGTVIRVGDRLTTFDAGGVYFLQEVARRSAIQAQRCLMDGGACEATAFNGLGYRACGLCLPLGNYHNIGPNRKIRAEYVSVSDLEGLLKLTVAATREWRNFNTIAAGLRTKVEQIRANAPRELTDK